MTKAFAQAWLVFLIFGFRRRRRESHRVTPDDGQRRRERAAASAPGLLRRGSYRLLAEQRIDRQLLLIAQYAV